MSDEKEFVTNENGEEIVNPELVKKPEGESEDEPVEKSEVEPEPEPEEEGEEVVEEEIPTEPKAVEGETPRERALRKEVERLRAKTRERKEKDIFGEKKEEQKTPKVDLSQYEPEEITKFKGILETLADDLGFVKKDDVQSYTYKDKANEILNEFLDNHPEYSPEKDKDDTLWNRFKEEYSLYKQPEDPKLLKKLFQKIHNEITDNKPMEKGKILAKQEKIKVASHGGTSKQKSSAEKEAKIDPSLTAHLRGFSKEDMQEIFGL
ncbi:hypothetical protein C4544_05170 [candidate division WS5 bacterium]|uniref:Uncharacterized protein n=1 Tax=candidate division WS5 bacterium TaxID=2093353 RepID=A0A419DBD9_9BACT|nr:MAG: hypothetical protein C4544_05170 [candidate division WS5 bacterium]